MGAVALGPRMQEVLGGTPLMHINTYAGHPAASAAALVALDVTEREGLVQIAAALEAPVRAALEAVAASCSSATRSARSACWPASRSPSPIRTRTCRHSPPCPVHARPVRAGRVADGIASVFFYPRSRSTRRLRAPASRPSGRVSRTPAWRELRVAAGGALRGAAARRDRRRGLRAPAVRQPRDGHGLPHQGPPADAGRDGASRGRGFKRCRTSRPAWCATSRTSTRSWAVCAPRRARALRPGRRRADAGRRLRGLGGAAAGHGRAPRALRADRHRRLSRGPPADARRRGDAVAAREGAAGHVHHQPDLLRPAAIEGWIPPGPWWRHGPADLDRAAGIVDIRRLLRIRRRSAWPTRAGSRSAIGAGCAGLLARQFRPDGLLRELAAAAAGRGRDDRGYHLYTFNEVARTERWRREQVERLTA